MSITSCCRVGARVLLIDDDPLMRRAVSRMLSTAGHVVTVAESVREAVGLLGVGTYDVVVTDVYMPDEDGLDALRQCRQTCPDTPVIAMSGRFTDDYARTLKAVLVRLGAVAALPKTAGFRELIELVGRFGKSSND